VFSHEKKLSLYHLKFSEMQKEFEIYTDGACIGNGQVENIGGWSFVCIERGELFFHSVGVFKNTTNNIQELTGVLNALRCCIEYKLTDFTIFSDSQYVVKGFNDWMTNWQKKNWKINSNQKVKNLSLWKELFEIKQQFDSVDLRWVKGHNGNQWNELADQLIEQEMAKDPNFKYYQEKCAAITSIPKYRKDFAQRRLY